MRWDWFFYWLVMVALALVWVNVIAPRRPKRPLVLDWYFTVPLLPVIGVIALLDPFVTAFLMSLDRAIETHFAEVWCEVRYRYLVPRDRVKVRGIFSY